MRKRRRPPEEALRAALGAATGPDRIGLRVVTGMRNSNRASLIYVNPADYRCSRLAREFADEWVEYVDAAQLRSGRPLAFQRAIHGFCTSVDEHCGEAAVGLSLADSTVKRLLMDWERSLPEGRAIGSAEPANLANALHLLIARRDEHRDRPVDAGLASFARGPVLVGPGKTSELDEFTLAEKRAMVRAAWKHVRDMEERLAFGRDLAARGRDPREGGWLAVPDLLRGLWRGEVSPADICAALPFSRHWPQELRDLAVGPDGNFGVRSHRQHLTANLIRLLYPTTLDLHAFRVLLIDATGHAPEEVCGFGESDVEFVPNGVRLTLTKQRAGLQRHRVFRNHFEADTAPVPATSLDGPRREASEVVRRLLAATAESRARVPHLTDSLFIAPRATRDKRLVFNYWTPSWVFMNFSFWLEHAEVNVAGQRHIGRLRKSTKVEKAIVARGRVAIAADDHQEQTFAGHYAQGTTLRVVSGEVITTAQERWFAKAIEGPTVVETPEALGDEALEGLGLDAAQAEAVMTGQLDMGVTSCKNPWQSPFSPLGELCAVAPLRCLECANAWILPSHLPQLLLFEAHLDHVRQQLPPDVFTRLWAQTSINLKAVLADRTESEIASARRQIKEGSVSGVPPEMGTRFHVV